jgi:hypothetical protein
MAEPLVWTWNRLEWYTFVGGTHRVVLPEVEDMSADGDCRIRSQHATVT